MNRRKLLCSGKHVSAIGLGCMSFSGFHGPADEADAHNTLAAAKSLGIDLLDTANVYGLGLSEEIIGRFLKRNRADFTIATKAGIWRDREHGSRGFRNDAGYLRTELEGSLLRLGIDHVLPPPRRRSTASRSPTRGSKRPSAPTAGRSAAPPARSACPGRRSIASSRTATGCARPPTSPTTSCGRATSSTAAISLRWPSGCGSRCGR